MSSSIYVQVSMFKCFKRLFLYITLPLSLRQARIESHLAGEFACELRNFDFSTGQDRISGCCSNEFLFSIYDFAFLSSTGQDRISSRRRIRLRAAEL